MPRLLSSLPIGAKVKDVGSKYYGKDIIFTKIAENHPGYPAGSTTLITEKIIALKASDAKEPGNSESRRRDYGNNRHIHSNLKQWLNSDEIDWYTAQHGADEPPNAANVWSSHNPYDDEPGFLTNLTPELKNAILTTTLEVEKHSVDGGGKETFTDKIFLLSQAEVGLGGTDGTPMDYFDSGTKRQAMPTAEAISNNSYTHDNLATNKAWYYWLRTPFSSPSGPDIVRHVNTPGGLHGSHAYDGHWGVRPALNLPSSILVSDTTDSDGAYTIVHNRPPTPPNGITVPETVRSNSKVTIAWGESTDEDGDTVGYRLERSTNGGSFNQIYEGSARQYEDTILSSWNKVRYRVKAYDTKDAESEPTTSPERTVVHNVPPEISGQDEDLGTKTGPFNVTYTVTDEDQEAVTVREKINGTEIRSYSVTLGQEQTAQIQDGTWLNLGNGNHTLEIVATDAKGASVTRTYTFTKNITKSTLTLAEPLPADDMITRTIISVARHIPLGAIFKVFVCNNGYDAEPTWEDVTQNVETGSKYFFTNETKTAANWGYNVKVEIERGTADPGEEIFIKSIGGNFE